jgi:hypothetical protein
MIERGPAVMVDAGGFDALLRGIVDECEESPPRLRASSTGFGAQPRSALRCSYSAS